VRMLRTVGVVLTLLALLLTAACAGATRLGTAVQRATGTRGEVLVRRPAQQLALSLADLPSGFTVAQELKPALDGSAGTQDPWGRISAYAVTYAPGVELGGAVDGWGDVISSVNAYVGTPQAANAFAAWRSAVPLQYRLAEDVSTRIGDETVVYVRGGEPGPRGVRPTCLVGLRQGNVVASVSVSAPAGAAAPIEAAIRFARLTVQRIQAVAGR